MRIIGLAGWSGSGKTTLVVRLLPELVSRGLTVSTLKHAHHEFDVDQPGKDSYEHRRAGACEVMVSSSRRWALMHEHRGGAEPAPEELIRHMTPVDLLIIEGFKHHRHAKLEIYRRAVGKPLLCADDPLVFAVASDGPVPEAPVPVIALHDTAAIADAILRHLALRAGAPSATAAR